jgi:3-oxoacyl-[acyl-carrier-protein] synthase-3
LNEELAAFAIQQALSRRGLPLTAVEMLAVGTTQGDLPVPGFASMVHGRLGGGPMEVLSAGGVCCSGMAALAGVARAVATGQREVGVGGVGPVEVLVERCQLGAASSSFLRLFLTETGA